MSICLSAGLSIHPSVSMYLMIFSLKKGDAVILATVTKVMNVTMFNIIS